jgi:hypothetical protein
VPWNVGILLATLALALVAQYNAGLGDPNLAGPVVALIGVGIQILANMLVWNRIERARPVIDHLLELDRKHPSYDRLVKILSSRLKSLAKPLCLIVDDYSRLDSLTKDVILNTLEMSDICIGAVFFIIFEKHDTKEIMPSLSIGSSVAVKPILSGQHEIFSMIPATISEKQKVAAKSGLHIPTETIAGIRLKEIAKGINREEIERLKLTVKEYKATEGDQENFRSIDLLRFLCLNTSKGGFDLEYGKAVSLFSQKDGAFAAIVKHFFNSGPLRRQRVIWMLGRIEDSMPDFLDDQMKEHRPIKIRQLGSRIFGETESSSIANHVIHTFWLSYWCDKYSRNDIGGNALQKIAFHAERAQLDSSTEKSEVFSEWHKAVMEKVLFASKIALGRGFLWDCHAMLRFLNRSAASMVERNEIPQGDRLLDRVVEGNLALLSVLPQVDLIGDILSGEQPESSVSSSAQEIDFNTPFLRILGTLPNKNTTSLKSIPWARPKDAQLDAKLHLYVLLESAEFVYWLEQVLGESGSEDAGLPNFSRICERVDAFFDEKLFGDLFDVNSTRFQVLDHSLTRDILRHYARRGFSDRVKQIAVSYALKASIMRAGVERRRLDLSIFPILQRILVLETTVTCLDCLLQLSLKEMTGRIQFDSSFDDIHYQFATNITLNGSEKEFWEIIELLPEGILMDHPVSPTPSNSVPSHILRSIVDVYGQIAMLWEELSIASLANEVLLHRALFLVRFTDIAPNDSRSYSKMLTEVSRVLCETGHSGIVANLSFAVEFFQIGSALVS